MQAHHPNPTLRSVRHSSVLKIADWLPEPLAAYLDHTLFDRPMRAIARERGCHASTILRQINRQLSKQDDPHYREALDFVVSHMKVAHHFPLKCTETDSMPQQDPGSSLPSSEIVAREARRILRRLCEKSAFLLVSPDMQKAAVFKEIVPGKTNRIAVCERPVVQAFILKEWIAGKVSGKLGRYTITEVGRAALKRLISEDALARKTSKPYAETATPFSEQHREYGERVVRDPSGGRGERVRYNFAESPLTALGRKRDKNGALYITPDLVTAGERLREDFELAQMGPRVTQNWENFLSSATRGGGVSNRTPMDGPDRAQARVSEALEALGPGLADIAFRCCCFLEGLETAEKRLGWSARSGKVVLKIALQRLTEHYGIGTMMGERQVG